ncbi:MAG: cysteine synthase A [Alphaproteobacteria bacterium]|nr:cysteine synthase A [Alphaproteobacteria bacterium]
MADIFSRHDKIYNDMTELIGDTPLVRINRMAQKENCVATIAAKLEYFNPLSSVKDRTALGMVNAAEKEGKLAAGGTLVEATSGNTGIGLAFIAALRGYKLILTMPENMSLERRKLLAYLGAEIVLTPASEGMSGSVRRAEEIARETPGSFMPKQFENPANPAIHYHTTGQEIWHGTKGMVNAFVAGVGTGGTLQGVAEALKQHKETVQIFAVQPASSPVLSGGEAGPHKIQGIGANFIPPILDPKIIDEIIDISDEDALAYARRLAREEGILAGISSGAAIAAAIRIAQRPEMRGKTVVALLPDTGERYLSSELFNFLN